MLVSITRPLWRDSSHKNTGLPNMSHRRAAHNHNFGPAYGYYIVLAPEFCCGRGGFLVVCISDSISFASASWLSPVYPVAVYRNIEENLGSVFLSSTAASISVFPCSGRIICIRNFNTQRWRLLFLGGGGIGPVCTAIAGGEQNRQQKQE